MAIKCKPLRQNLHCQLPLKRPILEFTNAPSRFFSMIFDSLVGKIQVNASDFSARAGVSVSEVQWKYNIFSGPTSVTLYPDRLAFDFPNLTPSDFAVVRLIMEAVHDSFPAAFPELDYERVEVQSLEHLDLTNEASVHDLLLPYEMKSVSTVFGKGQVIQRPATKFELISEDQRWQCTCTVERSLLQATAVFAALVISLRKMTPKIPFAEKLELAQKVGRSCLSVVGLEIDDVAA
jgi:hypothetical protein